MKVPWVGGVFQGRLWSRTTLRNPIETLYYHLTMCANSMGDLVIFDPKRGIGLYLHALVRAYSVTRHLPDAWRLMEHPGVTDPMTHPPSRTTYKAFGTRLQLGAGAQIHTAGLYVESYNRFLGGRGRKPSAHKATEASI